MKIESTFKKLSNVYTFLTQFHFIPPMKKYDFVFFMRRTIKATPVLTHGDTKYGVYIAFRFLAAGAAKPKRSHRASAAMASTPLVFLRCGVIQAAVAHAFTSSSSLVDVMETVEKVEALPIMVSDSSSGYLFCVALRGGKVNAFTHGPPRVARQTLLSWSVRSCPQPILNRNLSSCVLQSDRSCIGACTVRDEFILSS